MKLGAAIPVLNEWRFLPAVMGQLLRVVDRCVLVRPSRSQSGAPVKLAPVPDLDARVNVLEGNWTSEAETRNAGKDYLSDCDYVFLVDSDEILLDRDLDRLKALAELRDFKVIAVKLLTYWKTPEYRIDPPEDGTIKMVLRRDVPVVGVREVRESSHVAEGVICHHLSYVRTDEEILEKMRLSGHAREFRSGWYEEVWKAWDSNRNLENLHPVHPSAYRRAIHAPDPELSEVLRKWGCQ